MSLIKLNQGNKTILLTSFFTVVLFLLLALESFGVIPAPYFFFTTWGTAIFTIYGAVILFLETFYEGPRPNLKKDTGALINTIFAVILVIFGLINLTGMISIGQGWVKAIGFIYVITFILLGKELMFD